MSKTLQHNHVLLFTIENLNFKNRYLVSKKNWPKIDTDDDNELVLDEIFAIMFPVPRFTFSFRQYM